MQLLRIGRSRSTRPRAPRFRFSQLKSMSPEQLRALLEGEPRQAAEAIGAAARYGLVEAQTILGQILLDGRIVPRDTKSALQWFEAAAGGDHPEAMNMAGRCHELGWGTAVDPERAAGWYRRAAMKGYAWGQFNLANLLLHGLGVARDRREALAWYLRAAEQGHGKSMNLIGRFHDEGWELPRNPPLAIHWYRLAAEAGDFRGQYNYATCLIGQGHLAMACDWLQRAVRGGSADFLAAAGAALAADPEPRLREIGREALARCQAQDCPTQSCQAQDCQTQDC